MALGIPFISTDVGGVKELSNNGKFGKIIKGTDDSCKFIIDYFENNVPINKSEMQDYISKFTIPVQIKKINEILE